MIGGGIIGATLAWRLAQQGARVTVVEAHVWGGEASWAGAGMLVPGSEYETGSAALRFALESLGMYPEFVRELSEVSGSAIDFSLCGSVELAGSEAELEQLALRARTQSGVGIRTQALSRQELVRLIPAIDAELAGGILYPGEGQVDPRTVMAALRVACERSGVTIRESTVVVDLEWERGRLYASLGAGSTAEVIEANGGVLAAGAWSSQLGKYLPAVYPVKGHLLGYAMAARSLPHVLRYHHTYVVQRLSGYTVAGTNEERAGFDRSIDDASCEEIARRARRLWGDLPASPEDRWIGFRPGVDREGPYLERWQDSPLWLAYGHYRNGILLAPATAQRLSARILESLAASSQMD